MKSIPTATPKQSRQVLYQLVRQQRWAFAFALITLILGITAQLVSTRLLGMTIDAVAQSKATAHINKVGASILITVLVAGILVFVGRLLLAKAVERSMHRLRCDAFAATAQLPLGTIENVGVSEPLSRMTDDVSKVSEGMHDTFPLVATGFLTFSLSLVFLLFTSTFIALSLVIGFTVLGVAVHRYFQQSTSVYQAERVTQAGIVREIHEIAEGSRTIRTFRRQRDWMRRLKKAGEDDWDAVWGPTKARCLLYSGSTLAQGISLVSALVLGMVAYRQGWASLGTVSAAVLYVQQLFRPLGDMLDSLDRFQQATAASARLAGLTLTNADKLQASGAPVDGSIELEQVTFAYNDEHAVLHAVDLSIASGERIAVVGPSGAGKSTIAKLIAGIHQPSIGTVTVGSVVASSSVEAATTKAVAMVTQESHVFQGSIASNLRLAEPNVGELDMRNSLEAVGALSWVDQLPEGIDTYVGHGGHALTLLQTQQLALARIFIADPMVVILDEATASFDSDSARGVEKSFAALFEGRTVVTIAHRLDVASTADRVVMVDKGRIAVGDHKTLLEEHSGYATMWKHWSQKS